MTGDSSLLLLYGCHTAKAVRRLSSTRRISEDHYGNVQAVPSIVLTAAEGGFLSPTAATLLKHAKPSRRGLPPEATRPTATGRAAAEALAAVSSRGEIKSPISPHAGAERSEGDQR